MPVPSLRFRLKRLIVVVALAAIGVAAWFLLIRDDGGPAEPEKDSGAKAKRGPLSDDPVVRKMSVAEQARQILMLGFEGTTPDAPGVGEAADGALGAILVRAENWAGADAGKRLVPALTATDGVPPLVATSQEGGIYRALGDLPPAERALDIGRDGSIGAARSWAQTASKALVDAGFDLNLFPVADVATLDSPLAGRAFSDETADVAALTKAALKGCDDAGIACAPLHFPGLGAASQDTANGPATVSSPLEILLARDIPPFQAVAKDAPAIVISLALYPDFDAVVPAALTPSIATTLLREDTKFKGLAISDDLSSGAVKVNMSAADAAVQALAAGTDLIQISSPSDPGEIAEAIETAVASGDIPPERLTEAAERVIALKRRLGLVD